MSSEKVNEFLRELSPMLEYQFWHEFISRFLSSSSLPTDSDIISNWSHQTTTPSHAEINANIGNNWFIEASQQPKRTKPPPPPKPRFFKPPTKTYSPCSVVNNTIGSDSVASDCHYQNKTSTQSTTHCTLMGAMNKNNEITSTAISGSECLTLNGNSCQEKVAVEISPQTNEANDNIEATTINENKLEDQMSFRQKKELFQSKSISPNLCRTQSESWLAKSTFARSNSVPGFTDSSNHDSGHSSNQPLHQLSQRQPNFTSSSFYDPRAHPTIEEQVSLCREIAKQLVSDASNAKSKGRQMFERRVEKSTEWVTENEDYSSRNLSSTEENFHERTISEGPVNFRLLLDPRHVEDINTVKDVNEHIITAQEEKTRDTCKHIVQDLMSPEVNPNRGNTLFAKRVQKSEEWIIDEVADSVIDAARNKQFHNIKQNNSLCSSPVPSWSASLYNTSRYTSSSPIAGPVFTPCSLPSSRPSSAIGSIYPRFKDFNARPKPFCRAY